MGKATHVHTPMHGGEYLVPTRRAWVKTRPAPPVGLLAQDKKPVGLLLWLLCSYGYAWLLPPRLCEVLAAAENCDGPHEGPGAPTHSSPPSQESPAKGPQGPICPEAKDQPTHVAEGCNTARRFIDGT